MDNDEHEDAHKIIEGFECNGKIKFAERQKKLSIDLINKLRLPPKRNLLIDYTGSGKTVIALVGAISLDLPITFLVTTYATDSILKAVEMLGLKEEYAVALPMGRARIAGAYCKSDCMNCDKKSKGRLNLNGKRLKLKKKDFKGETVDARWVIQHYPQRCPYVFLRHYVNEGCFDVVITHFAFFTSTNTVKTNGVLIVDEAHEQTSPQSFQLSRYQLAEEGFHLENPESETELQKLLNITTRFLTVPSERFNDPVNEYFYRIRTGTLRGLVEAFLDVVQRPVRDNECRALQQTYEIDRVNPIDEKTLINAKLSHAIHFSKGNAIIALTAIVSALNNKHVSFFESTKVTKADLAIANLTLDEMGLTEKFLNVILNNPEFKVHQVLPKHGIKGYIEIHALTHKSEIECIYQNYEKIIEVTATPPQDLTVETEKAPDTLSLSSNSETFNTETINVVKGVGDENGDKRILVHIPKNECTQLLTNLLKKYNLLGIVKSKKDVPNAKQSYGGKSLGTKGSNSNVAYDVYAEDLQVQCEKQKGSIYWTYSKSSLSISTNLLGCLDGCFVVSCFQRDPATEENLKEYLWTQTDKLYQFISRISRPKNGKTRNCFVVIYDKKVFDSLKVKREENFIFREAKDAQEALSIIDGFAEPLPITPPKKRVTKEFDVDEVKSHKVGSYEYQFIPIPNDMKIPKANGFKVTLSYNDPESVDQPL